KKMSRSLRSGGDGGRSPRKPDAKRKRDSAQPQDRAQPSRKGVAHDPSFKTHSEMVQCERPPRPLLKWRLRDIFFRSRPPLLHEEGSCQNNSPDSRATIIIVSWDGKHLLAECLPAVLEAVTHEGGNHEILVVDNGSTDGSVEFI